MDLNHVEIRVKNGEVDQSRRQSEWEKNLVNNCTQKLLPVQKWVYRHKDMEFFWREREKHCSKNNLGT